VKAAIIIKRATRNS